MTNRITADSPTTRKAGTIQFLYALGILLIVLPSFAVPISLPHVSFTITSLGTLATGLDNPLQINGHGAIIGTVRVNGGTRAAIWRNGGLTHLPPLAQFADSYATGINDEDLIVGYCRSQDGKRARACAWRGSEVRPLLIPPWPNSMALAVNSRGQILIRVYSDERKPAYFLWTNGKASLLPDAPDPVTLNDNGQVVLSGPGAAIWQSGRVTILGGLPGGVQSYAAAINNKGWVVGRDLWPKEDLPGKAYIPTPDRNSGAGMFSSFCACLWQHGMVTALGPLPGDETSEALGLNALGQAVGDSGAGNGDSPSAGVTHAVLWDQDAVIDLRQRATDVEGWALTRANGINDKGQIIGTGYFRNPHGGYDPTGFLLSPKAGRA